MKIKIIEGSAPFLDEDNRIFVVSNQNDAFALAEYIRDAEASPTPEMPSAQDALAVLLSAGALTPIQHNNSVWKLSGTVNLPSSPPLGTDEYTDYSALDFCAGFTCWISRFPSTRLGRVKFTDRTRQVERGVIVATLAVPFLNDWSTYELIVLGKADLVFTDVADITVGQNEPDDPHSNWWYAMWGVDITEAGRAPDGTVTLTAQLKWNKDGSPCAHATTMWIDMDQGYAPKKPVTFDSNGSASFKVMPLGLSSGETMKVKLAAAVYSGIGTITVTV